MKRVRSFVVLPFAAATLSGLLVFGLMTWFTASIASVFLPGNQPAIDLTVQISQYVRWSSVFMPAAMLGSICFTAMEKATKSLLLAALRSFLLPVLLLGILPARHGVSGIWVTPLLAEVMTVLAAICLLLPFNRLSLLLKQGICQLSGQPYKSL